MIINICRRCGQRIEDVDIEVIVAWQDDHPCLPKLRQLVTIQPVQAAEPLAHGDWRRWKSRTQPCDCRRCHRAYLDHVYDTAN